MKAAIARARRPPKLADARLTRYLRSMANSFENTSNPHLDEFAKLLPVIENPFPWDFGTAQQKIVKEIRNERGEIVELVTIRE